MADKTGFHAGNGWYFKREDEGEVRVSRISGEFTVTRTTFDKDTWASIVASVSAKGEGAETFDFASAVHAGDISSCQIRQPESEAKDA